MDNIFATANRTYKIVYSDNEEEEIAFVKMYLIEGYWHEKNKPMRSINSWNGQKAFLKALRRKEKLAHEAHYKGYSTCRICQERNGSTEFQLKNWIWPRGFYHYVAQHNVKPSDRFIEFICS